MLFNSFEFIFVFLPITWCIYIFLGKYGLERTAPFALIAASLFFYGWWNVAYVFLLVASIVINFGTGRLIQTGRKKHLARFVLIGGIVFNLGLLGYFKYANFFLETANTLIDKQWHIEGLVLPLAISFFTFQQIAYLVDSYQGSVREYRFANYCLFVCFFPQLIAGPIVHHQEMMPQFARLRERFFNHTNIALGTSIFAVGLFKKVVLADGVAGYANSFFHGTAQMVPPTFFEAWVGTLAYTFQLYFDFSGYSDMAIGLARLFGIVLPLNFFSPYKSLNIMDFWRRWHMTLSRFLKDYLYIPLGGNRKGNFNRYRNLMVTMLLGGLWHGAGWTFVVWGGLHGVYLMVNHFWQSVRTRLGWHHSSAITRACAWAVTFVAVTLAWVFFRSESLNASVLVAQTMLGFNGVSLPESLAFLGPLPGVHYEGMFSNGLIETPLWGLANIIVLFLIAIGFPNTQQWTARLKPVLETQLDHSIKEALHTRPKSLYWRPSVGWGIVIGLLLGLSLVALNRTSEFLYFQF